MHRKRTDTLFEPIRIGNLLLRNRIKMPAMAIAMGEDGGMSDAAKAFYVEGARGGGFAGVELGETLAEAGKRVSIVEPGRRMGSDIDIIHRWVFLKNLKEAGAELLTQTRVLEVNSGGVKVEREEAQRTLLVDTVVPINIQCNVELAQQCRDKVPEVRVVGDCGEPAKLQEAITAGFLAGQKIGGGEHD